MFSKKSFIGIPVSEDTLYIRLQILFEMVMHLLEINRQLAVDDPWDGIRKLKQNTTRL